MLLAGRLQAAIEVLTDLETRHRPASEALKDWGNAHRFAGSGDRAAIGNLVYDALRKRLSHAHAMQSPTARAAVLSVAVRDWGEAPDALAAAFMDNRFAPEEISGAELEALGRGDPMAGAEGFVQADLPEWIAGKLVRQFGESLIEEGRAMAGRPPVDLRVNGLKMDRDAAARKLRRFGVTETRFSPMGLRIAAGGGSARAPNVKADETYLKGQVEIQDEGSQLAALLTGAKDGEQVLDYCAGAGGKSLALAARMHNKGQIFAHDRDRNRLAPIYDRLKRAGARNVQVRAPEDEALADLRDRMDAVLVDAPCSGSGTWRRRPDAKLRFTAEQLAVRLAEQATVLEEAKGFVKPGGRLVYVTCSILGDENEAQVAEFLKLNDAFVCEAWPEWWEAAVGASADGVRYPGGKGVLLTPHSTQTDGFFISVLRKS